MTKKYITDLTYQIIGCAIEVHRSLGPGLLESVYHKCLAYELKSREIDFTSKTIVPVYYQEIEIDTELRCDFLIEGCIVVELKSVEEIKPIFKAQLFTYMRLLNAPKGILINFNCVNLFNQGQKTYVNDLFSALPAGS